MKILALSLGPIFKDYVHGGSQKILREVVTHLGRKGHKIEVYCTQRNDNYEPFSLGENVTVFPTLRFKQTFPLPYKTSPHNIAGAIKVIMERSKQSDVIYVHDSGINFPFLYKHVPTVFSMRDFLYQETISSLLVLSLTCFLF